MGLLDQLKSLFTAPPGGDAYALWLYVKCKRCGAPVAVRVDLRNDPSLDDEGTGFILRKEIMDSKCFTLMRAELRFNAQHKITAQTIEQGEFISKETYAALTQSEMPHDQ